MAAEYLYHVTRSEHRASIASRGLLPRRPHGPRSNHRYLRKTQPAGVYMTPAPALYAWAPGQYADVWRVRVDGLSLTPDPLVDGAYVYGHRIDPKRLELVGRGFDLWAEPTTPEGRAEERRQIRFLAPFREGLTCAL